METHLNGLETKIMEERKDMKNISLTKGITKRFMVALMSATLVMSSVAAPVVLPVGVYAKEIEDNPVGATVDEIASGDTMNENDGHITTNNGTITTNYCYVVTNNGTIENNASTHHIIERADGVIISDNITEGYVWTNNGIIKNNITKVITNSASGVVENNSGSVGGSGTVTNNHGGNVSGNVTIVNYFGGTYGEDVTITNNFTDTPIEGTNQFLNIVNFKAPENGMVTYGQGTTLANQIHYLQTTGGTITISPDDGYRIDREGGDVSTLTEMTDRDVSFSYTLVKQENGSYVLTISTTDGNLYLNAEKFNMVISAIERHTEIEAGEVVKVIVKKEDTSLDNNSSSDQTPDDTNINEKAGANQALNMINNALKLNPGATVLELDFGKQTNLTSEDIKALCETRPDLAKKCRFSDNGVIFELYIPAIDIDSESYKKGLTDLENEKGKLAGYMRLAEIFRTSGFRCSEKQ